VDEVGLVLELLRVVVMEVLVTEVANVELTELLVVVTTLEELNEVDVIPVVFDDNELEVLEPKVEVDVLVVDWAVVVASVPQTIFSDTARAVAYTVGLAPELAADEA
jgi:hypothetical protein